MNGGRPRPPGRPSRDDETHAEQAGCAAGISIFSPGMLDGVIASYFAVSHDAQ
jgi:hypothetical protein